MTENHSNLIAVESEQEQSYQNILEKTRYLLTNAQYEELTRLASLYESLHVLLQPFDSDDNVGHIIALLNHINTSFFEKLDGLESINI